MITLLQKDIESGIIESVEMLDRAGFYLFLREKINPRLTARLTKLQFDISTAVEITLAVFSGIYVHCQRRLDIDSYAPGSEEYRKFRVFTGRYSLFIASETGLRFLHADQKQKHRPDIRPAELNFILNNDECIERINGHLIRLFEAGTKTDNSDKRAFELTDAFLNSLKNAALTGARQYEAVFSGHPELEHAEVLSTGFNRFSSAEQKTVKKMLSFKDYAGQESAVKELQKVAEFVKNPRPFKMWGAKTVKGFILYGPPGTGKTYLARVFADECNMPFTEIKLSDILSEMYGKGSQLVQELFNRPGVIFVDEMETLGRKVGDEKTHEGTEQIVNTMKQVMDGLDSKARNYDDPVTFYIGATNNLEIMEPALIRPGRLKPLKIEPYGAGGLAEVYEIQSRLIIRAASGERTVFSTDIKKDTIGKALQKRALVPADVEFILQSLVNDKAFEQARAGADTVLDPLHEKEILGAIEKYERSDESMLTNIINKMT